MKKRFADEEWGRGGGHPGAAVEADPRHGGRRAGEARRSRGPRRGGACARPASRCDNGDRRPGSPPRARGCPALANPGLPRCLPWLSLPSLPRSRHLTCFRALVRRCRAWRGGNVLVSLLCSTSLATSTPVCNTISLKKNIIKRNSAVVCF